MQGQYLRVQDAAHYLGVSVSFMEKRRLYGDGPAYYKLGKAVVYTREALDAFLTARVQQSTSEKKQGARHV